MTDVIDTADSQITQEAQEPPDPQPTPSAPPAPNTSNVADQRTPLDDLIASIRAAVASGVSQQARAVGAAACRTILTTLEAQPGQPLAAPPPVASPPTSPLAGMLSQLASMSREQIFEFLRAQFPSNASLGAARRLPALSTAPRFHLIQIPQVRPPGRRS